MHMDWLVFTPIVQERPWGGRAFEARLGRVLPPGGRFGESWEIVDRAEAQSHASRGPFAGLALREIMRRHAAALMGPGWDSARPFPLLVKWLDLRAPVSIQVHPPADYAARAGAEPKTECWYMHAADPGAFAWCGLKPGVDAASLRAACADGGIGRLLERREVRAGDSVFVPAGRIHAPGSGLLVLEVQQNSDTTYRIHDWGRVGVDGRPRPLHVEQALACAILEGVSEPVPGRERGESLCADAPEFRLRRFAAAPGAAAHELRPEPGRPAVLTLLSGAVEAPSNVLPRPGESAIIPASWSGSIRLPPGSAILLADRFC